MECLTRRVSIGDLKSEQQSGNPLEVEEKPARIWYGV